MSLIDYLHQRGIGVILDWVPAHFPTDQHGLGLLRRHAPVTSTPIRGSGFHPDWKSYIFNYGRHEVRSFLISSALFWLDKYHVDGLRVDGVASMLYRDYSRKAGEWIPNELRRAREPRSHRAAAASSTRRSTASIPDVQTIAEESTAWPHGLATDRTSAASASGSSGTWAGCTTR